MACRPGHRPGRHGAAASLTATLDRRPALRRPLLLSTSLVGAVTLRSILAGTTGEPAAGLVFAIVLLAIAVVSRPAMGNSRPRALAAGIGLGLALLLPGLWLSAAGLPPRAWYVAPPSLLVYSGALLVIAPAEEVFLRGVLQPALGGAVGVTPAIVATAILFAAIHVAAYGPAAIPLDFGVGLLFGWLRERTNSTTACAAAHLVADLGSWWLP
ncbi:MAG: lysostaphin resistance A-like protein [Candidatus Dormibacteria bacterium]